ncbi:M48 family metalloprotease (plasmid) [Streptomyces sp. BHT-5-2]|uniref:M48 family metalloprotease n=1 Tax=Streptomyces sp. BHT-5-2 TaxID=2866715 RepID=UPI001C8EB00E|nr:M48 family metalloprotease [Streptomyces sp. BHT-5-2]QZL07275.1 M48 family metalloprotease [Streptomyces sp. BHT-5-2]
MTEQRRGAPPPTAGGGLDRRVLAAGTHLRFTLFALLIATASVNLLFDSVPQGGGVWQVWVAVSTVVVFVCAVLLYWLMPGWKRRRSRLVEIRDPELLAELSELTMRAGLPAPPAFLLAPAAATSSAAAFGRWGTYTVSLHAGLVVRRARDPEGFRFVVLHELAHIRNRDVGIAYATEALWRSVAFLVLLPCTLLALYPHPWGQSPAETLEQWRTQWPMGLRGLFRIAFLIALILLARADVLRTRELYADLDAARWSGGARGLPGPGAQLERGHVGRLLRNVRRAWGTHPAWTERAASLLDPGPMFGIRASTMFLTGVLTAVVGLNLDLVVRGVAGTGGWYVDVSEWTAAALVTGIAGVAVWRAVAHAVACGERAPSGLKAGLWLGLGLGVGELATFHDAGTSWLPPAPQVLLLLVAGSAVLLWWAAQCAELWVTTCRGRSLVPSHLMGTAALFVVYGGWFTWWRTRGHLFVEGDFLAGLNWDAWLAQRYPDTPADQMPYTTVLKWLAYIPLVTSAPMVHVGGTVLWLFPLAAWARRRQESGAAEWLRRARPEGAWPELNGTLPSLRWLLTWLMAGGALCTVVLLGTRMWLHLTEPPKGLRSAAWLTQVSMVSLLAILVVVTVVTCAVYATTSRHRLALSLAAGGSVLLTGLATAFVFIATDACVPGAETVASQCFWGPRPAWLMVHTLVAPLALGLGFYAVTLVAFVGAVVSRRPLVRTRGLRCRAEGCERDAQRGRRRLLVATAAYAGPGILGAVACRAVLAWWRPARSGAPGSQWLPDVTLWTALSLVTVAGITAITVAVRARRAQWPARSVGAAAVSLLAGLLATAFLTAVEGCLPGLAALSTTCAVRPGPTWRLIQLLLLPRLLAVAMPAAALTVLAVLALRCLPHRGNRTPAPLQPGPGSLLLRRAYVLVACMAPLLLLTGQQQLRQAADPPTELGRQGEQAREKAAERQKLRTWLNNGGTAALIAYTQDYRDLRDALVKHSGADGYPSEVYRPICVTWLADGAQARKLSAPPVQTTEAAPWSAIADQAQLGGGLCLNGFTSGSTVLVQRGISQLITAADQYSALAQALYRILQSGN